MRQEAYAGLLKSIVFPIKQPGGAFDIVQKRASSNEEARVFPDGQSAFLVILTAQYQL